MDKRILHPFPVERELDLTETDIPWGRHGMSIGLVEDRADVETLRLVLSQALTLAARLTGRCRQYEVIVGELQALLRARRAA